MKKQRHPKNHFTIKFDEKKHQYWINEESYESVTRFIDKFFPKFDANKISKKSAAKKNIPQSKLLSTWKKEGEEGERKGTLVHNYVDCLIQNKPLPTFEKDYDVNYFRIVKSALKTLLKDYCVYKSEYMVACPLIKKAGTIDLLLRNCDTLVINDWKTNKELKSFNPWESAYPPVEFLDNTNLNKYKLQLNLYKYILQKGDYLPPEIKYFNMFVTHIKEYEFEIVQIPDMEVSITKMLEKENV